MKKTADMIAMLMLCAAMTDCGLENERAVADLVPERASSSASLVLAESESEEAALTSTEIIDYIIGNGSSSANSTLEVSKGFPLIAHTLSGCPLKFEFLGHEAKKEFECLVDASPNKTIPVLKFKHLLAEVPPPELLKFVLVLSENGEHSAVASSLLEKLTTPLKLLEAGPGRYFGRYVPCEPNGKKLGSIQLSLDDRNETYMYLDSHMCCSLYFKDKTIITLCLSPSSEGFDQTSIDQARQKNWAILTEFIAKHQEGFPLYELLELPFESPRLFATEVPWIRNRIDVREALKKGGTVVSMVLDALEKIQDGLNEQAQNEAQAIT